MGTQVRPRTRGCPARRGRVAALPERPHGLFLEKLDPRTGAPLKTSPEGGQPIHPRLAAVDHGWLATALIMVRNRTPSCARGPRRC